MRHSRAIQTLSLLALVVLGACEAEGRSFINMAGTAYDAVPDVLFSDPSGVDVHRLEDGSLEVFDVSAELKSPEISDYLIGEASFAGDVGDFTVTGASLIAGQHINLVVSAPGHAPTVFAGTLPEVSEDSPWFYFFTGAVFSEPLQTVAARIEALEPNSVLPDPDISGQGSLFYGQVVSDPSLGPSVPVEGAVLTLEYWDGAAWVPGPAVNYLDDEVKVDSTLTSSSTSGVFYAFSVPEAIVRISSEVDGRTFASFHTLSLEDGFTWLAAFHLPGQAP